MPTLAAMRPLPPAVDSNSNVALDSAASAASSATNCSAYITPSCLSKLYATDGYTPSGGANATGAGIGITGYLEQYANEQDLQSFYSGYAPQARGSGFGTVLVNGACLPLALRWG
jgi:tripeptidyl-peptidase-1